MTMTIYESQGVGMPIKKISLKTFFVHCGNYRKFEVDAIDEKDAREKFQNAYLSNILNTKGFSEKDITKIELKFK